MGGRAESWAARLSAMAKVIAIPTRKVTTNRPSAKTNPMIRPQAAITSEQVTITIQVFFLPRSFLNSAPLKAFA